ncbi:MAG: arsinothricin resistance N-acetyltransferase ArsN1 family B, partial [Solirubrobacteraceae bacterium]
MLLRHAEPERDGAACAAIYAPYVAQSAVSFEEVAPTAEQFAARIARTSARYPWLVLEDDGRVVGYAYATEHRSRAAYRWAVEVAVYVESGQHRRGAGRRLYDALLDLLRRQGLWIACAGVTLPNDASIALHRAAGFEHVGTYRGIGWKAGAWHDVSWWQLRLAPQEDGGAPPPEPRAPLRP